MLRDLERILSANDFIIMKKGPYNDAQMSFSGLQYFALYSACWPKSAASNAVLAPFGGGTDLFASRKISLSSFRAEVRFIGKLYAITPTDLLV